MRVAGVAEAIEARGAKLRYLPLYSPNLNPIEQLFEGQGAAPKGRSPCRRCALGHDGLLLDACSRAECANYLKSSGYVPSPREKL